MKREYRFLEHTADLGIEVTSPTLEGVYELAGQALFDLILPEKSKADQRFQVETEGDDAEALLVNFLNDLLVEFEIKGLLFRTIEVRELDATRLVAEALCEKPDLEKSPPDTVVKAVTWHGLEIEQKGDHWKGVVYLDL